ncbi:MAG: CHASE2 domain-containing protein, partial [Endomicrobiia bacterium]
MKKTKWLFSDFLIGLVISLIAIGLFLVKFSFFEGLEYKLYDLRAKFRKSQTANDKIVIVAIDDQSITNIGRWPWPRSVIAGLIEQISQFGPKVIGLNILFTDPDRNQGLEEISRLKTNFIEIMSQLQKKLKSKDDRELLMSFLQDLSETESSLDNDTILSTAIENAGNVVLPMFFTLKGALSGEQEFESPILSTNTITNIKETDKNYSVIEGFLPILPLDLFANVSKGIGHSNLVSDSDGVVRRECPVIMFKDKYYPSFALQLVRSYLGLSMNEIQLIPGKELVIGKGHIPLEKDTTMLIDFNGPAQTYPYYSVFDILTGKIPGSVFKDKIVIVGYMATGLTDLNVVPVGHNFPGTEIIANSIQNILEQRFIKRPDWAFKVELGTLIFCCLFITLILP